MGIFKSIIQIVLRNRFLFKILFSIEAFTNKASKTEKFIMKAKNKYWAPNSTILYFDVNKNNSNIIVPAINDRRVVIIPNFTKISDFIIK